MKKIGMKKEYLMQRMSHIIHQLLVSLLVAVTLITPAQSLSAKTLTARGDTEISHVWRFTYQQGGRTGTLDVMIVEMDEATHEILQILSQFTYPVNCTPAGNGADCDLHIRGAILQSYAQLKISASVPSAESYKWMIVEASGQWDSALPNRRTVVADHPSLKFAVESTSSNRANFSTLWNSNSTTSKLYKAVAGPFCTMTHDFDYEEYVGGVVTNGLLVDNKSYTLDSTTYPNVTTVGFLLAPSQIQIRVPSGFQLDTFVIDPGKPGYS